MELKTFFAQDLQGNVIPSPTVHIYLPGTTTHVAGLQDAAGGALANPFGGTANGQVVVAAPDGDYDLRVTGAGRDTTMRVRFIDVRATNSEVMTFPAGDTAETLRAAVVAATAAGGGRVICKPITYNLDSVLPLGAGVHLHGNGATIRATSAMANLVRIDADGCGIFGPVTCDGNSLCTSYVVDGEDGQGVTIQLLEIINWKLGLQYSATTKDVHGFAVDGVKVYDPAAGNVIYPFNVTGGPLHFEIVRPQILRVEVTGKGGDYQFGNGTADQVALQNINGGEIGWIRSFAGGENGVAFGRMCRGIHVHDIYASGNNGHGVQIGAAWAVLTCATTTGLVDETSYTASVSGATGKVDLIAGNKVYLKTINGVWTTADTIGGNVISAVEYSNGFTIERVRGEDNGNEAPAGVGLTVPDTGGLTVGTVYTGTASGATGKVFKLRAGYAYLHEVTGTWTTADTIGGQAVSAVEEINGILAGLYLAYLNGTPTVVRDCAATDTRGGAYKTQSAGLIVTQCANSINYHQGSNVFDGNRDNNETWSVSQGYTVHGRSEYQVSGVTIPALAPGDSAVIPFTLPGIESAQFVENPAVTGNTGLRFTASATTGTTVEVVCTNDKATSFAGASVVFRFTARKRAPGLSTTSGASAGAATVRKALQRSILSADSAAVNNSTVLVNSGLSVPVEAGRAYAFRALIRVASGATPGYKVVFNAPAGTTGGYSSGRAALGVAVTAFGTATVGSGSGTERLMALEGVLMAGAAGTLSMQFAQNVADPTNTQILAGSMLEVAPA